MTRAEDRLIVCGYHGKRARNPATWHSIVSRALVGIPETRGAQASRHGRAGAPLPQQVLPAVQRRRSDAEPPATAPPPAAAAAVQAAAAGRRPAAAAVAVRRLGADRRGQGAGRSRTARRCWTARRSPVSLWRAGWRSTNCCRCCRTCRRRRARRPRSAISAAPLRTGSEAERASAWSAGRGHPRRARFRAAVLAGIARRGVDHGRD